jgi:uncharacterized protein
MKKTVLFIHGGDSFSQYADFLQYLETVPLRDLPTTEKSISWRQTLSEDLGEEYLVYMPMMPNRQNADYAAWKIWFERYMEVVSGPVVLIGWSLGGMFLAKYLSENTPIVSVYAVYLLAAPGGEYIGDPQNGDCVSFKFSKEAAATITTKVPHIEIWHSEDDFVVPVHEVTWYEQHIPNANIFIFKDKNHFLGPELPELIQAIKAQESSVVNR